MAKKKPPDDGGAEYAAWAAEPVRRNTCQTCLRFPELLNLIKLFAADKAANRTEKGVAAFVDRMLKPRGYTIGPQGLRGHISGCVKLGEDDGRD